MGVTEETARVVIDVDETHAVKGLKNTQAASKRAFDQFDRDSRRGVRSAGRVGQAMASMGAMVRNRIMMLAGGFGAGMLMRSSIQAYKVQEQAVARVTAALKLQGITSKAVVKELQDYASSLQKVTTYGDEATLSNMATAISMGATAEQSKEMSRAAANMATALNISYDMAMEQLARTLSGERGRMAMFLGAEFKEMSRAELRAGGAIALAEKKFGGAAEALALTPSGQYQQAMNAIGDQMERLGARLLPPLSKLVGLGASILDELMGQDTEALTAEQEALGKVETSLADHSSNLRKLNMILERFEIMPNFASELVEGLKAEIGDLYDPIIERRAKEVKLVEELQNLSSNIRMVLQKGPSERWIQENYGTVENAWAEYNLAQQMKKAIEGRMDYTYPIGSSNFADANPGLWQAWKKANAEIEELTEHLHAAATGSDAIVPDMFKRQAETWIKQNYGTVNAALIQHDMLKDELDLLRAELVDAMERRDFTLPMLQKQIEGAEDKGAIESLMKLFDVIEETKESSEAAKQMFEVLLGARPEQAFERGMAGAGASYQTALELLANRYPARTGGHSPGTRDSEYYAQRDYVTKTYEEAVHSARWQEAQRLQPEMTEFLTTLGDGVKSTFTDSIRAGLQSGGAKGAVDAFAMGMQNTIMNAILEGLSAALFRSIGWDTALQSLGIGVAGVQGPNSGGAAGAQAGGGG